MKFISLILVFASLALAQGTLPETPAPQTAPVNTEAKAAVASVRLPLPQNIRDSIPWFAVFELRNDNAPFTRNHLSVLARNSNSVAFVYFATWCVPCREGLKEISKNMESLKETKTSIVLVNVGEREKDKIVEFLKSFSLENTLTVVDPFSRLTEGFGLIKPNEKIDLPRTILFDKSMRAQLMVGMEGDDYIEILKGKW